MENLSKYAVIRTGGKQYLVTPGETILVEKLDGESGKKIDLSDVLMVSAGENDLKIGAPLVSGAIVKATILGNEKDKKVVTFKKRRRKGYMKKQGHRQERTQIRIDSIG